MLCVHEVWRLNTDTEPLRCWVNIITINISCFLYLHMNSVCYWIKVKHNSLFLEPKCLVCLCNNRIDILIHCLFKVNFIACDLLYMVFNIGQGFKSFSYFKAWPPALYAVSRSLVNNFVDWQIISLNFFAIETWTHSLLKLGNCSYFF
jgi:hypothetical protein